MARPDTGARPRPVAPHQADVSPRATVSLFERRTAHAARVGPFALADRAVGGGLVERQCRDRQRLPCCRQEALLWIANPRAVALAARGATVLAHLDGAQMVVLSAQGMDATRIAEVTFASADRVRDVIHNFNTDGFDALYPRYRVGRPPTLTLPERHEIRRIALSRATDHDSPFSTGAWPSWPTSWWPRGWSRTPACAASPSTAPITPRSRHTEPHDPALHRLAQRQRPRPRPPPSRRQGQRRLRRH
jgi:Winged helix-turn helix